jgi:hypothetical protein
VATQQVGTTPAEEHRNHPGRPEEGNTLRHTPDGMGGLEGTCESFRPQLSVGPFHGGQGQERSKCLDHRGEKDLAVLLARTYVRCLDLYSPYLSVK